MRFIAPNPAPLDANEPSVPKRIPAVCTLASRPEPCFARFHALRPSLTGAVTAGTGELVAGAERYVQHDYAGAARAWRQLLAGHMALALVLPRRWRMPSSAITPPIWQRAWIARS